MREHLRYMFVGFIIMVFIVGISIPIAYVGSLLINSNTLIYFISAIIIMLMAYNIGGLFLNYREYKKAKE